MQLLFDLNIDPTTNVNPASLTSFVSEEYFLHLSLNLVEIIIGFQFPTLKGIFFRLRILRAIDREEPRARRDEKRGGDGVGGRIKSEAFQNIRQRIEAGSIIIGEADGQRSGRLFTRCYAAFHGYRVAH